jgi:hypothetical protein
MIRLECFCSPFLVSFLGMSVLGLEIGNWNGKGVLEHRFD